MKTFIIADPHRQQGNLLGTIDHLQEQGIEFEVFTGLHLEHSVVESINLSHKSIVKIAVEENWPEVCILEEDVWFPSPDGWKYFLANKPPVFDLYLGGVYGLNQGAQKRLEQGKGALEVHNFAGLHCYIISERYYQKFLSIPQNVHIDDQPGMGTFFVCYPFAALQRSGWSANNGMIVNYNTQITVEQIYKGNEDE